MGQAVLGAAAEIPWLGSCLPVVLHAAGGAVHFSLSAAGTPNPAVWNLETYNFTATSATTHLTITGLSTAGGDYIGLDNADVELGTGSAVPEPSTYTLVLCGIAFLGWAARRRRAR
jgi:hypothetical protein